MATTVKMNNHCRQAIIFNWSLVLCQLAEIKISWLDDHFLSDECGYSTDDQFLGVEVTHASK